jgi:hypothetical protein
MRPPRRSAPFSVLCALHRATDCHAGATGGVRRSTGGELNTPRTVAGPVA